jgi:hypothetical protein
VRLGERLDALLEKERIARGLCGEEDLERGKRGIRTQQRVEECPGALRVQGIQAELGVEGLAAPPVGVFRPIVDQE